MGARTLLTRHRRPGAWWRGSSTNVDALTTLPDRAALVARLTGVRPDETLCLLEIDLDGFRTVNDVLGQTTGDRVLQAVAAGLTAAVPPGAEVYRLAGDAFAVLLPVPAGPGGTADPGAAATVAWRAVAAVREASVTVEGADRVAVTACVGMAAVPSPAGGEDPLVALSASGAALRSAKAAGRGRVETFDRTAALVRRRRLAVEERLRAAVAGGALRVRYQPIVDLRTGTVSTVEALARWTDPELGTVDPQEFIAVAEETGLVVALGESVLDSCLRDAARVDLPARGVRVACNVSPLQLRVPGFADVVEATLAAHRLPPDVLVVEVTEAALVEEGGVAVATLRSLADLGVTVAIDDFGTGYSALGYLRRLPVHVLKVDRSLAVSLLEDPTARAVTRAVVDLGRSMGLAVVVEGIETAHVAELVAGMGVGFGQGSLYGRARPLEEALSCAPAGSAPPGPGAPRSAERDRDDPVVAVGG